MDTTKDKFVASTPCELFNVRLRALSLADANEVAGSSRICSILIDGNYSFKKRKKTAIFKLPSCGQVLRYHY